MVEFDVSSIRPDPMEFNSAEVMLCSFEFSACNTWLSGELTIETFSAPIRVEIGGERHYRGEVHSSYGVCIRSAAITKQVIADISKVIETGGRVTLTITETGVKKSIVATPEELRKAKDEIRRKLMMR